jgi:[protein-PII] uridylyltransferase
MQSDAAGLREQFERALASARSAHERGLGGHDVAAHHAAAVDSILGSLFASSMAQVDRPTEGIALVALGGYGRAELCPYSDIDVLLLHRGWRPADFAELVRRVLYPLWDAGRDLGHRARDVPETLRLLGRIDEAAALLDARHIAGDRRLFAELEAGVIERLRRSRSGFSSNLVAENAKRHAAHGHAGHLLEPDIRDSAGGLRDIHTLGWAGKLLPGGAGIANLVELGFMSEPDAAAVRATSSFLMRARVELHLLAGRRRDKLYLDEQDLLAERLGFEPSASLAPGDAFMRELYRHAREVDVIVTSVWRRLLHRGGGRFRRASGRPSGEGLILRDGWLHAIAAPRPSDDPGFWLHALLHSTRIGVPLSRDTLNRARQGLGGTIDWTPRALDAFGEILAAGDERTLEEMDRMRLLSALIPAWEPVRACPQRNLYHRYTVDMHCFAAVAELARSRSSDEPEVADAWSRIDDELVLLLATLLHDVGKGRGGDHSRIGAAEAARTCARMGLPPERAEVVAFAVREHLLLAETAVRRDLSEPLTISTLGSRIGSVARLATLFLLTRADALATGPEAWTPFRAALIREAYARTLAVLEHRHVEMEGYERALLRVHSDLLAAPREPGDVLSAVRTAESFDELVVVAADRPGLLATVSGVLAMRGLEVLSADILTTGERAALEVFRVRASYGAIPLDRWDSVRADIVRGINGELDVTAAIAAGAPRTPGADVGVTISNDDSSTDTIIEVHCADRPGLLSTITGALARAGCDIRLAKVATYGRDVVDVFYARGLDGNKLAGASQSDRIEKAVLEALA